MTTLSSGSPRTTTGRDWLVLLGFLVLCYAVAGLGSLATLGNVDGWYATAEKPPFNPPNRLFGPVWTVLYGMIAVSGWLLWLRRAKPALLAWSVQLVLNLLWTPAFFGLELLWPAFAIILALDAAVVWTIVRARAVRPVAAWLLVPYLGWILFASVLNASLAVLN